MENIIYGITISEQDTKLARQRRLLGYSQNLLAMKSGVNLRMIQQYESGARDISRASFQTIWLLSKALQCRVEDLVDVDIDVITDCIIKKSSGETLDTGSEIVKRTITAAEARNDMKHGWRFNWSEIQTNGYTILELYTKHDNKLQGRISYKKMDGYIYVSNAESAPGNVGSNGEYEGVGANLFAVVCKISKDSGFGGVVSFLSKKDDKVMNNYKEKLNAKQIGSSQLMIIDEADAEYLISRYNL